MTDRRAATDTARAVPFASFGFGTKGETLARLATLLECARLCEQMIVPVADWLERQEDILGAIIQRFQPASLAIRSSAADEDNWAYSNAGAYCSVTNVEPSGPAVGEAFARVIASYGENAAAEEVLIQPMVRNVSISGVVLTRDLDTGGPYYVINYDDYSGRTDTVTGGGVSKTLLVHRTRPDALKSERMRQLIAAVREIEEATGCDELDIEFCITGDTEIYVLQVRPLAARHVWQTVPDETLDRAIADLRNDLSMRLRPAEGISGATSAFAEMTDWNPAEMIGNTPRPLALSLYRRLITDRTWADARTAMGYRHVDAPLLVVFHDRPYVDVRLSLNSFLPATLGQDVADRLIDMQLDGLAADPNLHDKLEFEIAVTCRDFAFDKVRDRVRGQSLSDGDIDVLETHVTDLTRRILASGIEDVERLLGETARLERFDDLRVDDSEFPARVELLIRDCARHGTLPFAQLARHAFIAIALMKSLIVRGVITQEELDLFVRTTHTVASEVVRDLHAVQTGVIPPDAFLAQYGHLRPGTYDITSWRYDERPELFLGNGSGGSAIASGDDAPFRLSTAQRNAIAGLIDELEFTITPESLLSYVGAAIKARESAKFAFTRNVSDLLVMITRWGEGSNLSRDDLSYLSVDDLLAEASKESLAETIARNRETHLVARALRLPHLICSDSDIDVVRLPLGQPTFITAKTVTAPTVVLAANEAPAIDDRIVMIESADPGFDWIFSHRIAGLITKYGGANSHMAIRCAEFALPAAIGCGERLFEMSARAPVIELNCAARYIRGH